MKSTAVAAPLLMLADGSLRWFDGLDGHRKDGLAWDLGVLDWAEQFPQAEGIDQSPPPRGRALKLLRTRVVEVAAGSLFGVGPWWRYEFGQVVKVEFYSPALSWVVQDPVVVTAQEYQIVEVGWSA